MLITSVQARNTMPYSKVPFMTSDDIPELVEAHLTRTSLKEDAKAGEQGSEGTLFKLEMWSWEEDRERLRGEATTEQDMTRIVGDESPPLLDEKPPTAWMMYDELVQDQLSETYWRFNRLPDAVRDELRKRGDQEDEDDEDDEVAPIARKLVADVDPSNYIVVIRPAETLTSNGDKDRHEEYDSPEVNHKLENSAGTSNRSCNGKWIEINVATMRQRNLKTGKCRNVRMDPEAREVRLTWYWRENVRLPADSTVFETFPHRSFATWQSGATMITQRAPGRFG